MTAAYTDLIKQLDVMDCKSLVELLHDVKHSTRVELLDAIGQFYTTERSKELVVPFKRSDRGFCNE